MVRNQRLATAGRNHQRDTGGGGVTRSGHVFGMSWRHRAHEATDGEAAGEQQRRQRLLLSSFSLHFLSEIPISQPGWKQQARAPGTCRSLWCKAEQADWHPGDLGQIPVSQCLSFLIGNLRRTMPFMFIVRLTWNKTPSKASKGMYANEGLSLQVLLPRVVNFRL